MNEGAVDTASQPAGRMRLGVVLAAGQLVGRGGAALYLFLVIRVLTRAEYGSLAFAVSVGLLLVVLGDAGISRLIVRDLAREGGSFSHARRLLLLRAAPVAAACLLGLALGAAGLLTGGPGLWFGLAAFVLAEALAVGFEAVATGGERAGLIAVAQMTSGFVLIAWWAVILHPATGTLALLGLVAASVAKLAVHLVGWWRRPQGPRASLQDTAAPVWRQALPFFVFSTLAVLYYRLDLMILHAFKGSYETAGYAAAYRVVDGLSVLGLVAFNVLAPHFSRLQDQSGNAVWTEWCRYARLLTLPIILIGAIVAIVAEPLTIALFGDAYEETGFILQLLVPGLMFMLLSTLNGAALLMGDSSRQIMRLTAVLLAVNLALTFLGVLTIGARGAAAATSVSEILSFAMAAWLIRSTFSRRSTPGDSPSLMSVTS